MKYLYTIAILILTVEASRAQHPAIITKGSIVYEERVNDHALIKEVHNNPAIHGDIDDYLRNNPQFQVYNFSLYFDNRQTLYTPVVPVNEKGILSAGIANNIVYTDLLKQKIIMQKKIYDDVFLIKDDLRKIKWKITNETKEIAGYECRRANGLMFDSVYVVAFYCVDIVPRVGPGLFNGLPGMILEVSLPHEHVTWLAKSITVGTESEAEIRPPGKGKEVNLIQLKSILSGGLEKQGLYGQILIKNAMY